MDKLQVNMLAIGMERSQNMMYKTVRQLRYLDILLMNH